MSEQKFKLYKPVLVRDNNSKKWRYAFFHHYEDDSVYAYACLIESVVTYWKQCIPYKGNEHLIGTCESPEQEEKPEQKFEF